MKIDLKNLTPSREVNDDITLSDIDFEVNVAELVKDFVEKIKIFLSQIGDTANKLRQQLDTFSDISTQVNPDKVLSIEVYGYSQERFNNLVNNFTSATKDTRSVVRYLSQDRLDNAAKLGNKVAKYLGRKNDVFKLKKDPDVKGKERSTLKDHGFTLTSMVENLNKVKEILTGRDVDGLTKEVERLLSSGKDKDEWVTVASRFSAKAIDEFGGIAIELGQQQLRMLNLLSK